MESRTLTLTFESYWHVGDGRAGHDLDALVRRTPAGLPVVPGRQLKGRLREMLRVATRLGHLQVTSAHIEAWFGTDLPHDRAADDPLTDEAIREGGSSRGDEAHRYLEEARFTTTEGALVIGDATLGTPDAAAEWEQWARQSPELVAHLFRDVASTALEKDGTARAKQLRAIELAIPLELNARVEGPPEALDALRRSLPLLREIGAHGTRGLGRVTATGLEAAP